MTLQVGQLKGLRNPSSVSFDGRRLSLEGWLRGVTREEVSANRDTLLGYNNNPDEPAIPIIWEDDPWIDGMYRDIQFSAQPIPGVSERGTFDIQYNLDASLISRQVAVEAVTVGGFRTNGAGTSYDQASEVQPFYCVPANSYDYYGDDGSTAVLSTTTRVSATGAVSFVPFDSPTAITRRVPSYSMPLAEWYTGACTIEQAVGGGQVPLAGRSFPAGKSPALGWRISNGLIRLSDSRTLNRSFTVEVFDGTKWNGYELALYLPSNYFETFYTVTILRNSPESCVVRVSTSPGANTIPILIDVRLVRGSRFAEIRMATLSGLTVDWVTKWFPELVTTVELSSGGNVYGLYRSAADANSMRFYSFSSADVTTGATTDTYMQQTTSNNCNIAVGQQMNSLSGATYESMTALWKQYLGPVSARQRVVDR